MEKPFEGDFNDQVSIIVNDVLDNEAPQEEIKNLCDLIQPILVKQVKSQIIQSLKSRNSNNFIPGQNFTGNNSYFQFCQPQFGFGYGQPFMNPYNSYFNPQQMQMYQQQQQQQFGFF